MKATLEVMSEKEFDEWAKEQSESAVKNAAAAAPAAK
jgi:heme/copper-type cytochrome/quinol oxidase subunit 2